MQLPVKDSSGQVVSTIEVSDALLGVPLHRAVVHQALVAQRANARQGTSAVKSRGQVSGGGRKPRPQKHSGRSRQGSIRAPQWRGGGIVFGPQPRSYRQRLPKKMRRLAIRSLLSEKVRSDRLVVLDKLDMERPQTQTMAKMLDNLGVSRSALVVTAAPERAVALSVRNLDKTKWLPARLLNVGDLTRYQFAVITTDGLRQAEALWATGESQQPSAGSVPQDRES